MSILDRLYVEADHQQAVLSWLLAQWLHDVDREHADWCLEGLRYEDPELFAVLDAIHVEDEGRPLLDPSSDDLRTSDAPVDGDTTGASSDGGPGPSRPPAGSVVSQSPAGDRVVDLMAALEESVAAAKAARTRHHQSQTENAPVAAEPAPGR